MQMNRIGLIIGLAALIFSVFCISCEPRLWQEYVIAAPAPIEDLTVTEVKTGKGVIELSCTFIRPRFNIELLNEELGGIPDAYFFLRKEGASNGEEIGVDNTIIDDYTAGDTVAVDGMYVSENDIERGESYVLVGYSVDEEGQKSEPATSESFVIPLFNVYE